MDQEEATKIFKSQYGDLKEGDVDPADHLLRRLQSQLREVTYSLKTVVLQNSHAQRRIEEEQVAAQAQ